MRLARGVVLGIMLAALAGCVPPQRISVRNDGVMAIPMNGKAFIYDPRNEKLTVVQPAGDLADKKIWWADWSPDGKRMFIGGNSGSDKDMISEGQVGDADGTNFKKLFAVKGEAVWFAQWRPDGEAISFTACPDKGPFELRQVDVATGEIHVVMKNVALFHRWSPDKEAKAIFAVSADPHATGDAQRTVGVLVSVQPDGSAAPGVTIQAKGQPWLDVAPDGKSVIFCAPNEKTPFLIGDKPADFGPPKLQKLSGDPVRLQQLTEKNMGYAAYSPDGKHILFVELLAKNKTRVGVMNSDGTKVVNLDDGLTLEKGNDIWGAATFQPVWLSNQRVQYYKNPREGFEAPEEIWAIDINGKNKEDLGGKLRKLIDALPGKGE